MSDLGHGLDFWADAAGCKIFLSIKKLTLDIRYIREEVGHRKVMENENIATFLRGHLFAVKWWI